MTSLVVRIFEKSFRRLTLEDEAWVQKLCEEDGGNGGHINYISMFLCQDMYDDSFRKLAGCLIKKPYAVDKKLYCQCPIGTSENRKKAYGKLMKIYSKSYSEIVFFAGSDKNYEEMKDLFGDRITYVENSRENQNYVLDTAEQINLQGSKFADRRNKLRRFNKLNNWQYEEITKANIDECLNINAEWYGRHAKGETVVGEQKALITAFENYDKLNFHGGLIRIDGKTAGFCIGTPFNKDIYVCLFMKTDTEYRDSSIVLLHEFMQQNCVEYQYTNYSEDLGVPGLRKFKTMLHPAFMTPFYNVTINL